MAETSLLQRVRESRRFPEVVGLMLLVLAAVLFAAVVSFDGRDATWFHRAVESGGPHNWFGTVGASAAETLLQLFGVAAFVLPLPIAVLGWLRLRRPELSISGARIAAHLFLVLAVCMLLDQLYGSIAYGGTVFEHAGGYLGMRPSGWLRTLLGGPGALLLTLALVTAAMIVSPPNSFLRGVGLLASMGVDAVRSAARTSRDWWSRQRPRRAWRESAIATPEPVSPDARPVDAAAKAPRSAAREIPLVESIDRPQLEIQPRADGQAPSPPAVPKTKRDAEARQTALPGGKGVRGYALPPLELLNEGTAQTRESDQALLERADVITAKLREFSIDGKVVAIHPGPVVTTFEFKPDAGVKYSKITGMTDDLSLALRAESVRIDRMPGRATVGIEVPNLRQEVIFPRELIGSAIFRDSESSLPLALGKDIHGDVAVAELDRMPHLLIAGATGAGKSVGLNGMIVSMLYKSTPDALRFIMIDTKMIELGIYADIPHLLIPVVTDPKHASAALKWAVREMEQRYHKLAALGVRNIAQFNEVLKAEPDRTMDHPKTGEPVSLEHMPYIVIVIDEMADLMMVSSADVEESVMRLAQMARAVGIHLILATQRPSVDVITGTIKANFPSRIAFRVSQRVDSRTIIDQQGAEHLLGRGDMLYLPTGSARLRRLHSGYITESEIHRITTFLKRMAEPVYDETVLAESETSRGGQEPSERDEMFVDAVRTVINEGKCSITLIQRRLQLGYARAARIVDMMEQEGVVSPGEGSKPREVLVGMEYVEGLEAQL